ncbi:RHS repeat domain-containing protein [Maridesulfovibrio ferrireducens]|uniref:RHS repeat domain-containing protein n=1 Tax=Maridesulfovibrio ferrireducens TaxID=246191 RepID=UPI001A1DF8A4|nr:RHS repeat-associated core domain-containing protein [Maridesulfovibrio ferrireducens]MBI9111360.1 RHS repeat-associated core domain-containing protein [Maridesulfovibrio ferrireducens]
MQLDNMWEVVSRSSGAKLQVMEPDFSDFSASDRMYSSMMKPEVKTQWDQKNREWTQLKERFQLIKRHAHARFMFENPNLKLARDLAETDYGKELIADFGQRRNQNVRQQQDSASQQIQLQTGTGADLHDEFERDGVDYNPDDSIQVIPFVVPGAKAPYAVLVTARDDDGRIIEKQLNLGDSYHNVQYEYDAGGRLSRVISEGKVLEHYQYGKNGERVTSETVNTGFRQYKYDKDLRLIQACNVTYVYNRYGSLSEKKDRGLVTKYEYFPKGQISKVFLPDGRKIEYHCDLRGVRVAKSINGKIVEKYFWKDFTTLDSVIDGSGKNRLFFSRDKKNGQFVVTINSVVYYLASDQVGSVYMFADKDGNELKKIIFDSFGNKFVDTRECVEIPLGFAGGLFDKDTGLIHFGFREYDPEIGRFTAQDPLGFGGGDVDVYGYCLDDPINAVDSSGLMGSFGGFFRERHDLKTYYVWKANEVACDACTKKNGEISETPTMVRPHPNCKCRQVKCEEWTEYSDWEFIKEIKTISYKVYSQFNSFTGIYGTANWQKYYIAEEKRVKIKVRQLDGKKEFISETAEYGKNRKSEVKSTWAKRVFTGRDIENGDMGYSTNPWTGETLWFPLN